MHLKAILENDFKVLVIIACTYYSSTQGLKQEDSKVEASLGYIA